MEFGCGITWHIFQAVDEGVGEFFSARKVSREHVAPDPTTRRQNEINKEKSEEPGWVPVPFLITFF